MKLQEITSEWNQNNVEKLNGNFTELSNREAEIVCEILSEKKSSGIIPKNGLLRKEPNDPRVLNDAGINFIATEKGVIHRAWIYAYKAGKMGCGLAIHRTPSAIANEEVCYKVCTLNKGWNHVELNFPVDPSERYTLFKRTVDYVISTESELLYGWSTNPNLHRGGLDFKCGAYLKGSGTFINYSTFFEIDFITKLDQLYKLQCEQFYIGETPSEDAKYWFKPVGGE